MHFEKILSTIDTHTAGGPTRIITSGIPPLHGSDVAAKMTFFKSNFDPIRNLLMREPRGHRDMSGAVLTSPTNPDADVAAFFITASGYLPACVHSSIGIAVAGLSAGFIEVEKLQSTGRINMEIPAGLISLKPIYEDKVLRSVAVQTAPAFVLAPNVEIQLGKLGSIQISIVFSGVFFALVDVGQLAKRKSGAQGALNAENANNYAMLAAEILDMANRTCEISHPDKPELLSVDFAMFYEQRKDNFARNIVINVNGGIDRTPCGAGMGAKLADLFSRGQIASNDKYVLESFLGTQFSGRVLETAKVGPFDAVVPQIEGIAHITGMHQFVLDSMDTLREGLIV
jgi:proline racemase